MSTQAEHERFIVRRELDQKLDKIQHDENLSDTQKRIVADKELRELIIRLQNEGETFVEIAEILGTGENLLRAFTE